MFQFTDDCLIGIDSLDDDHRYLFELINRVLELLKEEPTAERQTQVNAILDKLTAYADHHFIKEEEYMEQIRDPELLKQRAQHEFFRQKLAEIQRSSQIAGPDQTQTLTELMNFLAKWLYGHILSSDIMIGKLPAADDWCSATIHVNLQMNSVPELISLTTSTRNCSVLSSVPTIW